MADIRFLLDDQLRIPRKAGREIRRQADRFIEGVGMQRLRSPKNRGHGFDRGPNDVVVGILFRQRIARGLTVSPEHGRTRIFGLKLFHELKPKRTRRPQLGHFHIEIHADGEEKREPGRELIHLQPAGDRRTHIFNAVTQGEGQFDR